MGQRCKDKRIKERQEIEVERMKGKEKADGFQELGKWDSW